MYHIHIDTQTKIPSLFVLIMLIFFIFFTITCAAVCYYLGNTGKFERKYYLIREIVLTITIRITMGFVAKNAKENKKSHLNWYLLDEL